MTIIRFIDSGKKKKKREKNVCTKIQVGLPEKQPLK